MSTIDPVSPYTPPVSPVASPVLPEVLVGGGFWRRVAAYIVDCLVVGLVCGVLMGVLTGILGRSMAVVIHLLTFALTLGYFAYLESSEWQATLGKRLFGMRVVDGDGYRLSPSRAVLRYVAAAVNWMLFGLGYLVVAFTPDKRGLHDMIASTRVVLEDPSDTSTPVLAWVIIGVWGALLVLVAVALVILALAVGGVH